MVTEFVVNWCQDKLPVIAGIGIHPLARSIEVVEYLSTLNVAGLLVVTPPYQKPPQRGLIDFFVALKAKTHLPIVAYNVPGRTAVNLLPQTVADLALKKSIAALKDSSASIEQLIETVRLSPPSFPILSGEDGLIHPAIVSGACGAISATANIIPRQLVELEHAARSGDGERAAAIQRTVAPVIRAAFAESNPIAVKFGLYALGVISEATVRTPLAYASDETQRVVREALGV
jgi:4-hydroxy-tetrahydrodipicolinate synthase